MIKKIILFVFLFFVFQTLNAQTGGDDPVLFQINNNSVRLSEFKYIYSKTSPDKSDFSRKSLEEYLDLYVKFKMKVMRAKELRLDTLESVMTELAGYRKTLADSYLIDKEVTEKLVKEAFDRSQSEVFVNHILANCERNASPEDTLKAYNKLVAVKKRLDKGENFNKLAIELSEDKSSKDKGGEIGYITAMLPDGFYSFESAAYNTPEGKYSEIIRSPLGYHILYITKRRPAQGEVEAAHILIRKSKEGKVVENAKMIIDDIYAQVKLGNDFGELAKKFSEDEFTNKRGGMIGYFGINQFERGFEDKAFGLQNNGDYTEPFESSIGWHIIKRIGRRNIETFDIAKNKLKPKVLRDGRHELAKTSIITRIKAQNNYKLNVKNLDDFAATNDTTFNTYKWKPTELNTDKTIFTLANKEYKVSEMIEYLTSNMRERVEAGNNYGPKQATKNLCESFVSERCLAYEESQLDKKYPEFKSLMREYEEGILLFEVAKNNVWDKASQDSVGLEKFYGDYKVKYQWNDRAMVNFISLADSAKAFIEPLRKFAPKKSTDKILKKFNTKGQIVNVREETFEKGKNKVLDAMEWKVGQLSANEVNNFDKSINFLKIEKIIPRGPKTLKESRGYVIADYQDFLEKRWVEDLYKKYTVTTNKDVLNTIIKK
jgi:peptidyl-prolyl cis-trans isomerase SurA